MDAIDEQIRAQIKKIDTSPADHSAGADLLNGRPFVRSIAIAYSGGLDSSVLLHLAHRYAVIHGITLYAFHIHHGLSPNANHWAVHCERECERLGIAFATRHITITDRKKCGVEEAARLGRYAALDALCAEHGVRLLLTAHHQDDQAETVLLHLLRGAGVGGLAGMRMVSAGHELLDRADLFIGRPLLDIPRGELNDWASCAGIAHIEDESNADMKYTRNALRQRAMPQLAAIFPGFQSRLERTARHAQAAQRLLDGLAMQDISACNTADGGLNISSIRHLDTDRIDNLLRYWFGLHGMRLPSAAWLEEVRTQLFTARQDAQICIRHASHDVRRHRDRIFITPKKPEHVQGGLPAKMQWNGESSIRCAEYAGTLFFDAVENGIDADWLRGRDLTIRYRNGGEQLKLAPNRPARRLKHHYQDFDIPAWEREGLPLVFAGDDLLYATGIGMDCRHLIDGPGSRIRLRWQPDHI